MSNDDSLVNPWLHWPPGGSQISLVVIFGTLILGISSVGFALLYRKRNLQIVHIRRPWLIGLCVAVHAYWGCAILVRIFLLDMTCMFILVTDVMPMFSIYVLIIMKIYLIYFQYKLAASFNTSPIFSEWNDSHSFIDIHSINNSSTHLSSRKHSEKLISSWNNNNNHTTIASTSINDEHTANGDGERPSLLNNFLESSQLRKSNKKQMQIAPEPEPVLKTNNPVAKTDSTSADTRNAILETEVSSQAAVSVQNNSSDVQKFSAYPLPITNSQNASQYNNNPNKSALLTISSPVSSSGDGSHAKESNTQFLISGKMQSNWFVQNRHLINNNVLLLIYVVVNILLLIPHTIISAATIPNINIEYNDCHATYVGYYILFVSVCAFSIFIYGIIKAILTVREEMLHLRSELLTISVTFLIAIVLNYTFANTPQLRTFNIVIFPVPAFILMIAQVILILVHLGFPLYSSYFEIGVDYDNSYLVSEIQTQNQEVAPMKSAGRKDSGLLQKLDPPGKQLAAAHSSSQADDPLYLQVSLKEFLLDNECKEAFRKFLMCEFSVENLIFLEEVRKFQALALHFKQVQIKQQQQQLQPQAQQQQKQALDHSEAVNQSDEAALLQQDMKDNSTKPPVLKRTDSFSIFGFKKEASDANPTSRLNAATLTSNGDTIFDRLRQQHHPQNSKADHSSSKAVAPLIMSEEMMEAILRRRARSIYDRFIPVGAPMELNLPMSLRKKFLFEDRFESSLAHNYNDFSPRFDDQSLPSNNRMITANNSKSNKVDKGKIEMNILQSESTTTNENVIQGRDDDCKKSSSMIAAATTETNGSKKDVSGNPSNLGSENNNSKINNESPGTAILPYLVAPRAKSGRMRVMQASSSGAAVAAAASASSSTVIAIGKGTESKLATNRRRIDETFFDEVEKSIVHLLQTDSFARFKKRPEFREVYMRRKSRLGAR